MSKKVFYFVLFYCIEVAVCLTCYNCTATQSAWSQCAGDFAPPYAPFNDSRVHLTNCTEDNAMCFVRTWRSRAKYAWIVQRGCYRATTHDTLPRTMSIPTRAMSCKKQRFADAEYTVCFCQANWCNAAPFSFTPHKQYLICIPVALTLTISNMY